ncbi:MAG: hypothetical protein EA384_03565 [Spirochaetaceae bacterium]|nr:MAG: hypothetical protein EA384_03565 [Spirochaetaceae bacterium]
MILFSIKKAFFDFWDHFLPSILCNLGFIVVLSIPMLAPAWFGGVSPSLGMVVFAVGVLLAFVYLGVASMLARDIVNYQAPEWATVPVYLSQTWPACVVLGLIYLVHAFLLSIALPVYTAMGSVPALAAMAFLFWASIIWLIASQFYLPIRSQLDTNVGKILKKSFLIVFDNTAFSIVVACGALLLFSVSIFTALLMPGIMGVLIWLNGALKLRLYKYDFLEEQPGSRRRDIPWDELLYEDRERVGKRSLKGMIFPWKE